MAQILESDILDLIWHKINCKSLIAQSLQKSEMGLNFLFLSEIKNFFPPKSFAEEELKYPSEDLIYSLISWGKFREAFNSYLKCKDQSKSKA